MKISIEGNEKRVARLRKELKARLNKDKLILKEEKEIVKPVIKKPVKKARKTKAKKK